MVLSELRRDEPFRSGERIAIVAAHPDDETIGCGALIQRLQRVAFIHVTDGAPRDGRDAAAAGCAGWADYAALRHRELDAALAVAGEGGAERRAFGIADQEASHHLDALARRLAEALAELRPVAVIGHPYEGGHPDHDAACFACHAAARLLEGEGAAPELIEMTSYHAGPHGIVTGCFLEPPRGPVVTVAPTAEEEAVKRRMGDCFASQRAVLAAFPLVPERFRRAPAYDFARPPHPGTLYYERQDWGMTGARWRAAAAAALRALGL
jgi:LmbE family N-acetylglucosaminyl deacetylase